MGLYTEYQLEEIKRKLDRIATLLEEMPQVMAATMLLMKQEVDEASMQGKKASDLYEINRKQE